MHPRPIFYHNRPHRRKTSAFVPHRLSFNLSRTTCFAHTNNTKQRRRVITHKPAMFNAFFSLMVPPSREVASLTCDGVQAIVNRKRHPMITIMICAAPAPALETAASLCHLKRISPHAVNSVVMVLSRLTEANKGEPVLLSKR